MNKQLLKLMMLVTLVANSAKAGVHVLADPSEGGVDKVVQTNQEAVERAVEDHNKQSQTHYRFQRTLFAPHVSLAFVSQNEMTVEDTKKQCPGLMAALGKIAAKYRAINLTPDFQKATIDYWPGKFEMECGGSKKKNYLNAVLKARENEQLKRLAVEVAQAVETECSVKQRFPFSAHLTLGRVYEQNDGSVEQVAHRLPREAKESAVSALVVERFKLKGHDQSEEVFEFLGK